MKILGLEKDRLSEDSLPTDKVNEGPSTSTSTDHIADNQTSQKVTSRDNRTAATKKENQVISATFLKATRLIFTCLFYKLHVLLIINWYLVLVGNYCIFLTCIFVTKFL